MFTEKEKNDLRDNFSAYSRFIGTILGLSDDVCNKTANDVMDEFFKTLDDIEKKNKVFEKTNLKDSSICNNSCVGDRLYNTSVDKTKLNNAYKKHVNISAGNSIKETESPSNKNDNSKVTKNDIISRLSAANAIEKKPNIDYKKLFTDRLDLLINAIEKGESLEKYNGNYNKYAKNIDIYDFHRDCPREELENIIKGLGFESFQITKTSLYNGWLVRLYF